MTTLNWSEGTSTSRNDLPTVVTTYFSARDRRDSAATLTTFNADAVVTDEDIDYRGPDEILGWLDSAAASTRTPPRSAGRRSTPGTSTWCSDSRATSPAG